MPASEDDGHGGCVLFNKLCSFDRAANHRTGEYRDPDADCLLAVFSNLLEIPGLNGGVNQRNFKVSLSQGASKRKQREGRSQWRTVIGRIEEDDLAPAWSDVLVMRL